MVGMISMAGGNGTIDSNGIAGGNGMAVTFGLHSYADTSDCIVSFLIPHIEAHVRYNLVAFPCTIRSRGFLKYDTISWLFLVRYQSRSHRYYDT